MIARRTWGGPGKGKPPEEPRIECFPAGRARALATRDAAGEMAGRRIASCVNAAAQRREIGAHIEDGAESKKES
jgi:hypothetical protein